MPKAATEPPEPKEPRHFELVVAALRLHQEGRYDFAVISLQTALEVYLELEVARLLSWRRLGSLGDAIADTLVRNYSDEVLDVRIPVACSGLELLSWAVLRRTATVDEFVLALPRGTSPSRSEIRRHHRDAIRRLASVMRGRSDIVVSGKKRRPTLRDDLKELRNRFFHYGHDQPGDDALRAAMEALERSRSSYVVRETSMRALRRRRRNPARTSVRPAVRTRHAQADRRAHRVGLILRPCRRAAWFDSRPAGLITVRKPGGVRLPLKDP